MVDANGANSEALGGPRGSSRLQRGGSLQKLGAPRKPRPSGQQAVSASCLALALRWLEGWRMEGDGRVACCRGVPYPVCSTNWLWQIAAVALSWLP